MRQGPGGEGETDGSFEASRFRGHRGTKPLEFDEEHLNSRDGSGARLGPGGEGEAAGRGEGQDGPRRLQDGPQRAQDGPNMAPRWPREAPRWPQKTPRWSQESPRWPQQAPRRLPVKGRRPFVAHLDPQRGPQSPSSWTLGTPRK